MTQPSAVAAPRHRILVAAALPLGHETDGVLHMVGRFGGPCRLPRVPLTPGQEAVVRAATEAAIEAWLA